MSHLHPRVMGEESLITKQRMQMGGGANIINILSYGRNSVYKLMDAKLGVSLFRWSRRFTWVLCPNCDCGNLGALGKFGLGLKARVLERVSGGILETRCPSSPYCFAAFCVAFQVAPSLCSVFARQVHRIQNSLQPSIDCGSYQVRTGCCAGPTPPFPEQSQRRCAQRSQESECVLYQAWWVGV